MRSNKDRRNAASELFATEEGTRWTTLVPIINNWPQDYDSNISFELTLKQNYLNLGTIQRSCY